MAMLDEDQIHQIACEVSHDMREGLADRERWNNQAMMLALNTIEHYRSESERLQTDLRDTGARNAVFFRTIKKLLGFENWPDMEGDFVCGVAKLLTERFTELQADSDNYRAECDTCGTRCMDMLTDDHCAVCDQTGDVGRRIQGQ